MPEWIFELKTTTGSILIGCIYRCSSISCASWWSSFHQNLSHVLSSEYTDLPRTRAHNNNDKRSTFSRRHVSYLTFSFLSNTSWVLLWIFERPVSSALNRRSPGNLCFSNVCSRTTKNAYTLPLLNPEDSATDVPVGFLRDS